MNSQRLKNRNKTPFLEARSVSFSYSNTGRVLNSVSFFVGKGERIAILGHNGSGKSTLAKILGGLIEPNEGSCLIEGVDIKELEFRKLRNKIGMVFQDPENQIIAIMVEDDVAFAPENQGLLPEEIQRRVDWAIEQTDLVHKKNSSVSELSGGEKQRLALAGALAADVECLILDEPMSMLDPESRLKIEKILRQIHADGMTLIQITHIIEPEYFEDIDRVIVLSKGEIIWQGITEEFWNNAERLGFEADYDDIEKRCPRETEGLKTTDSTASALFKIKNLSFRYDDNKIPALKNLSAEIFVGEWLSIIGRTGSGKSTLVQHLNALYKIQEGEIFFNSERLPQKGEEVYKLRQRVGLVFQNPEDQLFSTTIREELAFAPKNAGFEDSELDEAISYAIECVGLDKNFLERNPLALSGGERRLVAIASVLSAMPECLVLDEPLAGLDTLYRKRILRVLSGLRDSGTTVITVTHDVKTALKFSDRILIMSDGEAVDS